MHTHEQVGCEGTMRNGNLVIKFPSCITNTEYIYISEMLELMKKFAKRCIFKGRYEPRFGTYFINGRPM